MKTNKEKLQTLVFIFYSTFPSYRHTIYFLHISMSERCRQSLSFSQVFLSYQMHSVVKICYYFSGKIVREKIISFCISTGRNNSYQHFLQYVASSLQGKVCVPNNNTLMRYSVNVSKLGPRCK